MAASTEDSQERVNNTSGALLIQRAMNPRFDAFHLGRKGRHECQHFYSHEANLKKKCYQEVTRNSDNNNNNLANRPRFAPAVVEGGPRRCQRQTLTKLIPLPGHLAELQQDGVQVVTGMPVVIDSWGWGGCFTINRRTWNGKHITEKPVTIYHTLDCFIS